MKRCLPLLGLLALGACAATSAGPRERALARLDEFQRHAGAPVRDFHFWRIDRWEGLGPDYVAIWTRLDEAWLIRVRKPCHGLDFANAIAVTSTNNRVHQRHDTVRFDQQRCQIAEIRPVDGKALKAERRARARAERD